MSADKNQTNSQAAELFKKLRNAVHVFLECSAESALTTPQETYVLPEYRVQHAVSLYDTAETLLYFINEIEKQFQQKGE